MVSPNENNRRAKALREPLGTAPTPGTNTILITHKSNIIDALGKDWFDVKEGEAPIFRPENGGYRFIARVQIHSHDISYPLRVAQADWTSHHPLAASVRPLLCKAALDPEPPRALSRNQSSNGKEADIQLDIAVRRPNA